MNDREIKINNKEPNLKLESNRYQKSQTPQYKSNLDRERVVTEGSENKNYQTFGVSSKSKSQSSSNFFKNKRQERSKSRSLNKSGISSNKPKETSENYKSFFDENGTVFILIFSKNSSSND